MTPHILVMSKESFHTNPSWQMNEFVCLSTGAWVNVCITKNSHPSMDDGWPPQNCRGGAPLLHTPFDFLYPVAPCKTMSSLGRDLCKQSWGQRKQKAGISGGLAFPNSFHQGPLVVQILQGSPTGNPSSPGRYVKPKDNTPQQLCYIFIIFVYVHV